MNHESCIGTQGTLTPINMGLYLSVPISSTPGSPSLSYRQPLIAGHQFSAVGILTGANLFLLIAQHLFRWETVPLLDLAHQQLIQMPVQDFQEFLKIFLSNSSDSLRSSTNVSPSSTLSAVSPGGVRGFISPLPPGAPLVVSIYLTADFSNQFFSPSTWLLIPILSLPGVRGALPILLLSLLATIFVRSVVSPQSTGAKPLPKREETANSSLSFSPEELLRFLSRFGKYFSSH